MELAPFALILVIALAAGIVVQLLGATKSRYDFLIVGLTAAFGMYFASESFPGSAVFSTITSFGPAWGGFVPILGLGFGFVIATIAYLGTRETYRTSTPPTERGETERGRGVGTQIVRNDTVVADPPLARLLFSDRRMAPVWFVVRIFVGFSWLDAGWHKILDTGAKTNYVIDGAGILAFWQRVAAIPAAPARPIISYDFYRSAIQFMVDNHWEGFFGKLIAFGETAVGLGLICGAFVGIAAVGGAFMNLNFMLAGSTSSNPVLLLLGFLLVLAWKTAGYIGLDRYLLPILGTPWKGVRLAAPTTERPVPTAATT